VVLDNNVFVQSDDTGYYDWSRLTTKPSRFSLLFGKYLAVTLFSFVSVVATMIGAAAGFMIDPSTMVMGVGTDITCFSIPPLAVFLAVIISITFGMTFSGLEIALSTYAKSLKRPRHTCLFC